MEKNNEKNIVYKVSDDKGTLRYTTYCKLPPGQDRQLVFEYQVVQKPDGEPVYAEKSIPDDGKASLFKFHDSLDQIFADVALELAQSLN